MTERRAARLGLAIACLVVVVQLSIGAAWSLTHDDPTPLDLTRRCFEREKGLVVEAAEGDAVAGSASGGALRTSVEGNLLTVAVVRSRRESDQVRGAYIAAGSIGTRLETRGRYVQLWLREPSPTQRQAAYDCEY